MEKKWRGRRDSREKLATAFKSARIPMMLVTGFFVVALFGIPLMLGSFSISAAGGVAEAYAAGAYVAVDPPAVPPSPAAPTARVADPSPSPSPESAGATAYMPLQNGDTDPAVASLQQRLMELFYMDPDEPTEHFGPSTEAAVKRFQRSHYMKETGVADELTQSILFSANAKVYVLEKGNSGEDVKTMQQALSELGYYGDKVNGYFGVATARALTAFQQKNALSADGLADSATRDALFSPHALPAVDPEPTESPKPPSSPKVTASSKPSATPRVTESEKPQGSASPKPSNSPKPSATPKATATPKPESTVSGGAWGNANPNWTEKPTQSPALYPSPTAGGGATPTSTPSQSVALDPPGAGVESFIAIAMAQEGKPYVYSTEGPDSFDCSGLVYYALRLAGISTRRYSAEGFSQVESWGTVYGTSNLERGDLIFFKSDDSSRISHTGIWLGSNKYIHASSSAGKVIVSSWSDWANRNFVCGKRVY